MFAMAGDETPPDGLMVCPNGGYAGRCFSCMKFTPWCVPPPPGMNQRYCLHCCSTECAQREREMVDLYLRGGWSVG